MGHWGLILIAIHTALYVIIELGAIGNDSVAKPLSSKRDNGFRDGACEGSGYQQRRCALMNMEIELFNNSKHREQVVKLWNSVFEIKDARNKPELSIDKKLSVNDDLFFIAKESNQVIGTIMAGYDGHRGWVYYVAVHPDFRRKGIGTALMQRAEKSLWEIGCSKLNLQIRADNSHVQTFYESIGYDVEERISMGKKLPLK